jgi:hypothetical protein
MHDPAWGEEGSAVSVLVNSLGLQIHAAGLPTPELEFMFAKEIGRRWRFDLSWPWCKLAVEVDGGVFVQGRHSRGMGQLADMEKGNCAILLGWRVLHVGKQHIKSGEALKWIEQALEMRP